MKRTVPDDVAIIERFVQLTWKQRTEAALPESQVVELERLAEHLKHAIAGSATGGTRPPPAVTAGGRPTVRSASSSGTGYAAGTGPSVAVSPSMAGPGPSSPAAPSPAAPSPAAPPRATPPRPASSEATPIADIALPDNSAYTPSERPVFERDYYGDDVETPLETSPDLEPLPTDALVPVVTAPLSAPPPLDDPEPAGRPEAEAPLPPVPELDPAELEPDPSQDGPALIPDPSTAGSADAPPAAPTTPGSDHRSPASGPPPGDAPVVLIPDPPTVLSAPAPPLEPSGSSPGPRAAASKPASGSELPPETKARRKGRSALVYLKDGGSVRGSARDWDPGGDVLQLRTKEGQQQVGLDRILVAFMGPAPGREVDAKPAGTRLKVKLTNGKRLVGVSPDYASDRDRFTLIPDARSSGVDRVWIPAASVSTVDLG